jgi:hypothetical protein
LYQSLQEKQHKNYNCPKQQAIMKRFYQHTTELSPVLKKTPTRAEQMEKGFIGETRNPLDSM